MYKWRVEMMESERGWGQDYWHRDFDTEEEAVDHLKTVNGYNTSPVAPDYYVQALSVEKVWVEPPADENYVPKHRKETT